MAIERDHGCEMSETLPSSDDKAGDHTGIDARRGALRPNQRAVDRYRLMGSASLSHAGVVLQGHIIDLSIGGIGLMLEVLPRVPIRPAMSWLCHVESRDLPCRLTFVVRVVRQRQWHNGAELGCEIVAINNKALRALNAFRTLAMGRKSWRDPSIRPVTTSESFLH